MNRAVLLLDLRIRRVSTLMWWVAAVVLVLVYISIYPSIRDTPGLSQFVEELPEAFREAFAAGDYSTPVGYLQAEVFSGLMPVIVLVLAIGRGSSSVAGEEEMGRLDVVMSHPVRRREIYLAKTVNLMLVVALVAFGGVFLPIVALGPLFGVDVAVVNVLAACLQLFLLGLLAGLLAQAGGAATGRRSAGIALATTVFAAGFLIDTLGRTVDWMENLRPFTPWRWYNGNLPLSNGLGAGEVLVLGGACVVVVLVGLRLFNRRDLRV